MKESHTLPISELASVQDMEVEHVQVWKLSLFQGPNLLHRLYRYPGLGWDRVDFLSASCYSAVLWL